MDTRFNLKASKSMLLRLEVRWMDFSCSCGFAALHQTMSSTSDLYQTSSDHSLYLNFPAGCHCRAGNGVEREREREKALLSENEVIDSFLKSCLEPMHAAEQISEITPRFFGYDRKHPVVMYYSAAGVLCGNIFCECSCNTLPTAKQLPNGVRTLSYKINHIRLCV